MNQFYRNNMSQIKTTGKSLELENLPNGSLTHNEAITNESENERINVTDNKYHARPNEKIKNSDFEFFPNQKQKEVNVKTRSPSVSKSYAPSKENSYLKCNISKISDNTSIKSYLERRHQESQQKINLMRQQKLKRETENMLFKPKISENSKKIINEIIKREIIRAPKNIEQNNQDSINNLIRSSSNSNLTNQYVDKTYQDLNINRSADIRQLHQERSNYETNKENDILLQRDNISLNKLKEKDIIKRPASTSSRTTNKQSISSNINNKLINEKHLPVAIKESFSDRNIKLSGNNVYPKEVEKGKVLEVRNKLNDYYNEQINSELSSVKSSSFKIQNKLNRDVGNQQIQSGKKSSINVQEDSVNKLFELGGGYKNIKSPVKLQDKNNSNQYNTIQAISIKSMAQNEIIDDDDDNYPNKKSESGAIMNKRREDLNILKNFANNVSVNQSDENKINKNTSYDVENPNYSISPSIYNKKNIYRNQKEIKHEMNSLYKLDKVSKEFLINKMSNLNTEQRYLKQHNFK